MLPYTRALSESRGYDVGMGQVRPNNWKNINPFLPTGQKIAPKLIYEIMIQLFS